MRPHRDLPSGSQGWASDVDTMRKELDDAKATIRRLCEILRVDPTRPDLNVNPQTIAPAVNSADKQKLSGLADTDTYNVADKQVLTWSNPKQAWVPENLKGIIPIADPPSYVGGSEGIGHLTSSTDFAYFGSKTGGFTETWGSKASYVGSGLFRGSYYSLIELSDTSGDPYIQFSAIGASASGYMVLATNTVKLTGVAMVLANYTSSARPTLAPGDAGGVIWDSTLKKPIFWNGTAWTDANGTTV